ncbi:hypothetical protein G6F46_001352 [Rhizopus delemar]|uniref:Stress response protein NST1 n=2 Tax=Rhizopus TaxID=4842 RepID=A0A9P6ZC51_9FUNG|nr:hypothetical protein G6F55_000980 [Rhizopus delemar]KAG1553088.1 hypothetical protein G6F51_000822 [Rhizopus arrhizus]KAG1504257.1 hypothetical protein G6F54_001120 [Rhizopus delemar]KAG1517312.1 hypothetical protein G6F53_001476 [Rhizopus delemar]KAG1528166.1 hypothetical protein G6F52_000891 [Rhizopus delemar]
MTIPTKSIRFNSSVAAANKSDIWDNTEERQKIRRFWIQLSEEERRSLVKVEKETVLRRMKEQQKHTCNCSVCGKKSSVIEEELEVLYDAYYEELEKYAYRQQQQRGNEEVSDSTSDEEEEEEEAEVSIKLKNTLTVKGNVITLADDLMRNDGKKFLKMMEKITDQKLKREQELQSDDEDDVYDEEEGEENDTEEYDEYEEEDDEYDDAINTEEQKIEQGKKMFQVFAARMFEQRVMQAYREKVAQDRQRRLIEELEEEDRLRQERELKKLREREKKKETKRLEKLKQEQEKLKMEEKKKQEEEEKQRKLKEIQEQERKRREEEKRQKETERQKKEAERQRKEDEKKKREQEELEKKKKEMKEKRKKQEEIKRKEEEKSKRDEELRQKAKELVNKQELEKKIKKNKGLEQKSISTELLNPSITSTSIERPRKDSVPGPIGGPVAKEQLAMTNSYQPSYNEHSFFTNYLFGQSSSAEEDYCKSKRRISYGNVHQNWTNGWTVLSDTVHEKLFGDVIADRSIMILSRAKEAYLRLNEIAESKYRITPNYHSLTHIQGMMNSMYSEHVAIDTFELYETLNNSKSSEFECVYNQQGYLVRLMNIRPRSSSIPAHIPTSSINYTFNNNNPNGLI